MKRKSARQFPGATPYFDRHNRRRWRFRKRGFSAELGTDYGSEEFVLRYEAAIEGQRAKSSIGAARTVPGSLSALVASYYRSKEFLGVTESTRATYRGVIEPLREQHGDKRVAHLQRPHVLALMAAKAGTPAAANNLRKRLKALLDHAVDLGWRADNPAASVKPFKVASQGFHTWNEDEIAQYLATHPLGSVPHAAMALMLYTGAARSDVVTLGWSNIRDDRILYRRRKTIRSTATLIDIRIHPDLAEVLNLIPRNRFTFLQTSQGRARSAKGLGTRMREWCDQAGLPECSAHGLRKAIARRLAEAGCTPHEIASVTGHATLKEVERYSRDADRAGMADDALDKLQGTNRKQNVTNQSETFANIRRKPLSSKEN